jgi:hypothetical protein
MADMRKRRLMLSCFLLYLSATLLAHDPSGFSGKTPGQGKRDRPKFYALRVVFEKNVQNAKDSVGAPDGRNAEILPGGQLVVLMENKLYPFPSISGWPEGGARLADSGSVVGKGEADFGLEGWLPMKNTQGKQHYVWISLGLSVTGFCIWLEGSAGVEMIRMTNPGTTSLFVDAVIGYGRKEERR